MTDITNRGTDMVLERERHREAGDSRLVRWAARGLGTLCGAGLTVLVSVGLATSAGADDGGSVLGQFSSPLVETVDQVTAPVVREVVEEAVEPIVEEAVSPVAKVTAPVVQTVAPPLADEVVEPIADDVVEPVVELVQEVVEPLVEVAAPATSEVTGPVTAAVQEVVAPVRDVVEPVSAVTAPVVDAVLTPAVADALAPVLHPALHPALTSVLSVLDPVLTPVGPALDPLLPVLDGVAAPIVDEDLIPGAGSTTTLTAQKPDAHLVRSSVALPENAAAEDSELVATTAASADRRLPRDVAACDIAAIVPWGGAPSHAAHPGSPLVAAEGAVAPRHGGHPEGVPAPVGPGSTVTAPASGGACADVARGFILPPADVSSSAAAAPPSALLNVLLEVSVAPD